MSIFGNKSRNGGNGKHPKGGSANASVNLAFCKTVSASANQAAPAASANADSRRRILVVDDDESMRNLLAIQLNRGGFAVREAPDGPEGLTLARRWLPDLILLDVMLPGTDGLEICRLLREQGATANIPVIMLTAATTLEQKLAAFEAGADDYLAKPYESAELIARIHAQLRDRHAHRQHEDARGGRVITIFSLSGGVGKTSAAVNLAVSLSGQPTHARVALIDTVFAAGQVGVMLNLNRRNDWGELAKTEHNGLTSLALHSFFVAAAHGNVHALLAPAQPEDAERIDAVLIRLVLDFCRRHYSFTMIDTPPSFDAVTLAVLDSSDLIVLTLTPSIASIVSASKAMCVFRDLGYREEQIVVLSNHARGTPDMGAELIANTLNHQVDFALSYGDKEYDAAINRGVPYVTLHPKSVLTREFCRLADLARKRVVPDTPAPAAARNGKGNNSRPHAFDYSWKEALA